MPPRKSARIEKKQDSVHNFLREWHTRWQLRERSQLSTAHNSSRDTSPFQSPEPKRTLVPRRRRILSKKRPVVSRRGPVVSDVKKFLNPFVALHKLPEVVLDKQPEVKSGSAFLSPNSSNHRRLSESDVVLCDSDVSQLDTSISSQLNSSVTEESANLFVKFETDMSGEETYHSESDSGAVKASENRSSVYDADETLKSTSLAQAELSAFGDSLSENDFESYPFPTPTTPRPQSGECAAFPTPSSWSRQHKKLSTPPDQTFECCLSQKKKPLKKLKTKSSSEPCRALFPDRSSSHQNSKERESLKGQPRHSTPKKASSSSQGAKKTGQYVVQKGSAGGNLVVKVKYISGSYRKRGPRVVSCRYCADFKTSDSGERAIHVAKCHPFYCTMCYHRFCTEEELRIHKVDCEAECIRVCFLCRKNYLKMRQLQHFHGRTHQEHVRVVRDAFAKLQLRFKSEEYLSSVTCPVRRECEICHPPWLYLDTVHTSQPTDKTSTKGNIPCESTASSVWPESMDVDDSTLNIPEGADIGEIMVDLVEGLYPADLASAVQDCCEWDRREGDAGELAGEVESAMSGAEFQTGAEVLMEMSATDCGNPVSPIPSSTQLNEEQYEACRVNTASEIDGIFVCDWDRREEKSGAWKVEVSNEMAAGAKFQTNKDMVVNVSATDCGNSMSELNPLHHIPPSTQLNGGRYVMERVGGGCVPSAGCVSTVSEIQSVFTPCPSKEYVNTALEGGHSFTLSAEAVHRHNSHGFTSATASTVPDNSQSFLPSTDCVSTLPGTDYSHTNSIHTVSKHSDSFVLSTDYVCTVSENNDDSVSSEFSADQIVRVSSAHNPSGPIPPSAELSGGQYKVDRVNMPAEGPVSTSPLQTVFCNQHMNEKSGVMTVLASDAVNALPQNSDSFAASECCVDQAHDGSSMLMFLTDSSVYEFPQNDDVFLFSVSGADHTISGPSVLSPIPQDSTDLSAEPQTINDCPGAKFHSDNTCTTPGTPAASGMGAADRPQVNTLSQTPDSFMCASHVASDASVLVAPSDDSVQSVPQLTDSSSQDSGYFPLAEMSKTCCMIDSCESGFIDGSVSVAEMPAYSETLTASHSEPTDTPMIAGSQATVSSGRQEPSVLHAEINACSKVFMKANPGEQVATHVNLQVCSLTTVTASHTEPSVTLTEMTSLHEAVTAANDGEPAVTDVERMTAPTGDTYSDVSVNTATVQSTVSVDPGQSCFDDLTSAVSAVLRDALDTISADTAYCLADAVDEGALFQTNSGNDYPEISSRGSEAAIKAKTSQNSSSYPSAIQQPNSNPGPENGRQNTVHIDASDLSTISRSDLDSRCEVSDNSLLSDLLGWAPIISDSLCSTTPPDDPDGFSECRTYKTNCTSYGLTSQGVETKLLNPLMLTPPSAQLRGGRCEHKRVNQCRPTVSSCLSSGGQCRATSVDETQCVSDPSTGQSTLFAEKQLEKSPSGTQLAACDQQKSSVTTLNSSADQKRVKVPYSLVDIVSWFKRPERGTRTSTNDQKMGTSSSHTVIEQNNCGPIEPTTQKSGAYSGDKGAEVVERALDTPAEPGVKTAVSSSSIPNTSTLQVPYCPPCSCSCAEGSMGLEGLKQNCQTVAVMQTAEADVDVDVSIALSPSSTSTADSGEQCSQTLVADNQERASPSQNASSTAGSVSVIRDLMDFAQHESEQLYNNFSGVRITSPDSFPVTSKDLLFALNAPFATARKSERCTLACNNSAVGEMVLDRGGEVLCETGSPHKDVPFSGCDHVTHVSDSSVIWPHSYTKSDPVNPPFRPNMPAEISAVSNGTDIPNTECLSVSPNPPAAGLAVSSEAGRPKIRQDCVKRSAATQTKVYTKVRNRGLSGPSVSSPSEGCIGIRNLESNGSARTDPLSSTLLVIPSSREHRRARRAEASQNRIAPKPCSKIHTKPTPKKILPASLLSINTSLGDHSRFPANLGALHNARPQMSALLGSHRPPRSCVESGVSIRGFSTELGQAAVVTNSFPVIPYRGCLPQPSGIVSDSESFMNSRMMTPSLVFMSAGFAQSLSRTGQHTDSLPNTGLAQAVHYGQNINFMPGEAVPQNAGSYVHVRSQEMFIRSTDQPGFMGAPLNTLFPGHDLTGISGFELQTMRQMQSAVFHVPPGFPYIGDFVNGPLSSTVQYPSGYWLVNYAHLVPAGPVTRPCGEGREGSAVTAGDHVQDQGSGSVEDPITLG